MFTKAFILSGDNRYYDKSRTYENDDPRWASKFDDSQSSRRSIPTFDYGHQTTSIRNHDVGASSVVPQVIDYGHGRTGPRTIRNEQPPAPTIYTASTTYAPQPSMSHYQREPVPQPTLTYGLHPLQSQHPPPPQPPLRRPEPSISPFRLADRLMAANPPAPLPVNPPNPTTTVSALFPAAQHLSMRTTEAPSMPHCNPEPPVASNPEPPSVVPIDDLLYAPARDRRPPRLLIIVRGLPGSGKSYLCKMVREKEIQAGGAAPRTLSLDDYMAGGEDDDDDVSASEMEEQYREQLFRAFKRQIDEGYFSFLILDAVHARQKDFLHFAEYARRRAFQVGAERKSASCSCVSFFVLCFERAVT